MISPWDVSVKVISRGTFPETAETSEVSETSEVFAALKEATGAGTSETVTVTVSEDSGTPLPSDKSTPLSVRLKLRAMSPASTWGAAKKG